MTLTNNAKIALAAVGGAVVIGLGFAGYTDFQNNQSNQALDPGWTLVSTADTGDRWYVNDSSVSYEAGRYAEAWVMNNQAKTDKDGTRSYKTKVIFDCQNQQYRMMTFIAAKGQNGHGEGNGTDGPGPTRDMPPGTNIANVADYVCKPLYQPAQPSSYDQPQPQSRQEELKQL